jgi:hypothetical protein
MIMGKFIDLSNMRFGRLLALSVAEKAIHGSSVKWNCICDCGSRIIASGKLLRNGHTKSCGCLVVDGLKKRCITHGLSQKKVENNRLYRIWCAMKYRCYNKNDRHFQWYGGKGVKVCDEWQDFIPFMKWALSHGYTKELTIDRIDSEKNYTPENCQWITREENSRKSQLGNTRVSDQIEKGSER